MAIEDPAQVIAPVAQELACSPRFVIGDSVFDCALAKRFHKPTGNGSYPIKPFGEISICPYGTKKYVPVSSGHWAAGDSQSSLHSVKPLYSVPRVRTKERAIVVVNLHCGWRLEIIDRRVFVVSSLFATHTSNTRVPAHTFGKC
jgi:hypothetical protein